MSRSGAAVPLPVYVLQDEHSFLYRHKAQMSSNEEPHVPELEGGCVLPRTAALVFKTSSPSASSLRSSCNS